MTRPTQIQKLIEWLREPGRKLAYGMYSTNDGLRDAIGRLVEIRAGSMPKACSGHIYDLVAEGLLTDHQVSMVTDLSDNAGPLAVADYLEQQFPVTE